MSTTRARQYLIVRSSQRVNVYGRFTAELLVSEGLTGFDVVDLDAEPLPDLQSCDLGVLTRCFLHDHEIESLYAGVERGAGLVCFHPSPRLAARLGWESEKRVIHPGYVSIAPGYPGAGVPIQTHVPVALYCQGRDEDAIEIVARAARRDEPVSDYPAAALQRVGAGRVAVLFYDLPAAVAGIRFGDPALDSCLTTGVWGWCHAGDLYDGHVDESVQDVPQADFHSQLLAKLLTDVVAYPLPRLWYYPAVEHRAAAVFQSDGDGSTAAQFRELADCMVAHGARATFYLVRGTKMTEAGVAELRSAGHTFGPHIDPGNCRDEWFFDFPRVIAEETEGFRDRFGACSSTLQCHCAPWQGYMDWVPEFQKHGFRLLFAHLSLPLALWHRFMCGSGRPLKFCDREGSVHDCWQQPVVLYDDTTLQELLGQRTGGAVERFEGWLRDVVERTHTTVPILSHPVSFATYSRPFMEACFDRLVGAGVPIFNGDEWRDFIDRRAGVRVDVEVEGDGTVRCRLAGVSGGLSLMLPVPEGQGRVPRVLVDGVEVEGTTQRRLEQEYLFVAVGAAGRQGDVCVEAKGIEQRPAAPAVCGGFTGET